MATNELVSPSGPWDPGRDAFMLDGQLRGTRNLDGWQLAIDTEHQRMSSMLHMTGYKLQSPAKSHAFYAVFGVFSHAVSHRDAYNPAANWVSVGYYATDMTLRLELDDPNAVIWDAGPTSTVGGNQTGFNIGGSLSGGSFGGEAILQAGVSGSFGASFSSPDVRFAQSKFDQHVQWDVKLPGVGFVSPGVPANPEEPSFAGYEWNFGAIVVTPAGKPFALNVHTMVSWNFDYTRGITYDTKPLSQSGTYTYQGGDHT
jgi:hypothetical protein